MSLGSTDNNPICIEVEGPGAETFDTDCALCLGPLISGKVWKNPHPLCCHKLFHVDCIEQLVKNLPKEESPFRVIPCGTRPECPLCKHRIWLDHQGTPLPWEVLNSEEEERICKALKKSQVRRAFECPGFLRIAYWFEDGHRQYFDPTEVAGTEFLRACTHAVRSTYLDPAQLDEFEQEECDHPSFNPN